MHLNKDLEFLWENINIMYRTNFLYLLVFMHTEFIIVIGSLDFKIFGF